jgi:transcription initiation factor TFIIIB Brf1 subunit/transcription initiation factor TFIIB
MDHCPNCYGTNLRPTPDGVIVICGSCGYIVEAAPYGIELKPRTSNTASEERWYQLFAMGVLLSLCLLFFLVMP